MDGFFAATRRVFPLTEAPESLQFKKEGAIGDDPDNSRRRRASTPACKLFLNLGAFPSARDFVRFCFRSHRFSDGNVGLYFGFPHLTLRGVLPAVFGDAGHTRQSGSG